MEGQSFAMMDSPFSFAIDTALSRGGSTKRNPSACLLGTASWF